MNAATLHALPDVASAVRWLRERVTGTLQTDSRLVAPGDGFIAWPGAATDGRAHVADALVRGAVACLVERQGVEAFALEGEHLACMAGLKAATGPIAAAWFDQPAAALRVLAVTGTNGKTTTAWWLADALNTLARAGHAATRGSALVGTLGMGVPPALEGTGLTTPDPVRLQRAFRRFVDQGCSACAIEASSIGLAEARLAGTPIHTAIFTNFTQDHLDYHGSMADYWLAKRALFDWPGLQSAVINVDDPAGHQLHAELSAGPLDLWSVSAQGPARLQATDVRMGEHGLAFTAREGSEAVAVQTRAIGHFNVLNLLGVLATLRSQGIALPDAAQACADLQPVPGRMQRLVAPGLPVVAVDYAHTPDALEKALLALQPLARERSGALWCVFGCGGDRDAAKRPLMGAVAQQHADRVVLTSDNPRSEDPATILHQILQGTIAGATVQVEPDRAAAIALAVGQAQPHDVVLIAGKGHEDTQEIAGIKRPFVDLAHAQRALQARGGAAWA